MVENRFTGQLETIKAAVVINAGHRLPDETLWDQIEELRSFNAGRRIIRLGDCVAPRTIHDAIREGRRAAMLLG